MRGSPAQDLAAHDARFDLEQQVVDLDAVERDLGGSSAPP
jgi:hypothetical protein